MRIGWSQAVELWVVATLQITRAFEMFLQTEFWRLIRDCGWKAFVLFNTITNNLELAKHCLHIRMNHLKLPFLDSRERLKTVAIFLGFGLIHDFLSYSQRSEIYIIINLFLQISNQWGKEFKSAKGPRPHTRPV